MLHYFGLNEVMDQLAWVSTLYYVFVEMGLAVQRMEFEYNVEGDRNRGGSKWISKRMVEECIMVG